MPAARRKARIRGRLDRAAVVAAGRDLLDDDGLDALTMARVGDRLGVTAMALYRHVDDRRDLENAIVELVLGDLTAAAGAAEDWEHAVERWMRQVRGHWLQHPWLGSLLGTDSALVPPWLATLDRLAQPLLDAGFAPDVVAVELVRISRTTVGILLQEIRAPLPHAATFGAAMLAGAPEPVQQRWEPLLDPLAAYTNDDLFDDLVAATLTRLRGLSPTG